MTTDVRQCRFSWPLAVLVLVTLASTTWAVRYAWSASQNLPLNDAALWVRQSAGGHPVSARWLWAQHNEHRLPLVKLAYVGLVRATDDFRAPAVGSAVLLTGASVLLALSARRVRGRTTWGDLAFPLLLCTASQHTTLGLPFQIQFAMSTAILAIATFIASGAGGRAGTGRLLAVAGCAVAGVGCGGVGVLTALPAVVWLTVEACRSRSTIQRAILAGAVTLIAGLVVVYLVGLQRPAFGSAEFSTTGFLRGMLDLASTALVAFPSTPAWTVPVGASVCLVLGWALARTMAGVFGRPLSSGALGVFVQTAGAVALLLGIAAGRAGWPAGTLLEPRYTVLTSLVVALACVALSRGRAGAVVSAVVLFGTLVFLPRNWAEAAQEKERANASFAVVRETAGLRVPVECVAQKWWGNLPAREPILARVLAVCAARGIGPYAGLPAPLDARELTELQLDVSKTSGPPFEFALPRAMNVAGVRVRIRMSDDSVMQNIVTPTDDPDGPYLQPAKLDPAARATPTLRWDDARSPRVFTDERLVKLANRLPRNGKAEVVFWSTARVSTIRFEPDARPLDCSVESVSVLVMPDEWARVLNLSIGERR